MDELKFEDAKIEDFKIGDSEITPVQTAVDDKQITTDLSEQSKVVNTEDGAKADKPEVTEPLTDIVPDKVDPPSYNFKDEFIKGVVDFYEKTGDITPYLQAKLADFNGMTDEDLMRRELRESYPDVSDKAFEKLYKQQVVEKFKLDPDQWEEDDVELGKELLKSEASKVRSKLVEWQNGFKAPEPKPDTRAEEMTQAIQEFEQKVKSNEATRSLLESKRIAIKTTDGEFNYELQNSNDIVDMTIDNTKFFGQFAGQDGQIDYNKWYLTTAFAQNPENFIKSIGNYFKGLGREEITKEIKNPSTNVVGDVPTETSGDFTTGLLQAFANRGISK
jgi:hypothetical protein